MPIKVGSLSFDDEQALNRHVLSIRDQYEFNKEIKIGSENGQFLSALLSRHPDWPFKFISGVSGFRTGRYQSRNQNGFSRIDRSGWPVSFSYKACVQGRNMTDERKEFLTVIRSVEHALDKFEREPDKKCNECRDSAPKYLARHLPPRTLFSLWNDYKESTTDPVMSPALKFAGQEILLDWRHVYDRNAVLERLCVRCYYQLPENKT